MSFDSDLGILQGLGLAILQARKLKASPRLLRELRGLSEQVQLTISSATASRLQFESTRAIENR
jgi:hypothetical protein